MVLFFQNYNLVPDLNVYENVVLPVELDGRKVDEEYVSEILELLGLSKKKDAFPRKFIRRTAAESCDCQGCCGKAGHNPCR